ncbi:MAG TPA: polymer-forming cytoskeletal protein [Allosphingosinicella sp.]|jgi:cytoskeletal protein CcmA (bactofilin family)
MNSKANSAADEGPSVIGSGILVNGNIEAEVDLQIRGRVVGDVRCGTLVLGEQGEIRGNVAAERVWLSGLVDGTIETGDLAIEATARVKGDLTYSRIRMADGAVVQGRMSHVRREAPVAAESVPMGEAPNVQTPPSPAAKTRGAVYIE